MEGHICDQKKHRFAEEAAFDLHSDCPGSEREWPVQTLTWHSVLRDLILNIFLVFLIPKLWNKTTTNEKELILAFSSYQKMENAKEETSDPVGLT